MYVLKTPENKKVVINRKKDDCLFEAARNPPNTGQAYLTGTDLYRHIARSGKAYYYTFSWSMWQGSEDVYLLVTEEEAKEFLIERDGLTGWAGLTAEEEKHAEEVFPGIFEEDA